MRIYTIFILLLSILFSPENIVAQEKSLILFNTINDNDTLKVKELVKDSVDANLVYSKGPWMKVNMLIAAVLQHNYTTCQILVSNHADVNWRDGFNMTALMYAIDAGDENIVKLLLNNNADVFADDGKGNSISVLIQKSKNRKIKKMVEEYQRKKLISAAKVE